MACAVPVAAAPCPDPPPPVLPLPACPTRQDPAKRQELHDLLASTTHTLLTGMVSGRPMLGIMFAPKCCMPCQQTAVIHMSNCQQLHNQPSLLHTPSLDLMDALMTQLPPVPPLPPCTLRHSRARRLLLRLLRLLRLPPRRLRHPRLEQLVLTWYVGAILLAYAHELGQHDEACIAEWLGMVGYMCVSANIANHLTRWVHSILVCWSGWQLPGVATARFTGMCHHSAHSFVSLDDLGMQMLLLMCFVLVCCSTSSAEQLWVWWVGGVSEWSRNSCERHMC